MTLLSRHTSVDDTPAVLDLLITGGMVVTPWGHVRADIGVRGGKICALGKIEGVTACDILDAKNLHILPGVIDSQVHFREPGMEHKEDIESGTRGAILGGVTSVFEMPNTVPPTTDQTTLQDKLNRAAGRAWCDYAFFAGATPYNADLLPLLEEHPGCAGIKIFMGSSTGDLLVSTDEQLRDVLASGRRRVSVHCEDQSRLDARQAMANSADPGLHPVWRDVKTAFTATQRLLRLAHMCQRRVHVLHVTTQDEIELLARHRDRATVEVTPQHLTLCAPACYRELGSLAQMNPPIREKQHRDSLWQAIISGVVDVIGSDHAPHTREEKNAPYPQSPSGMTGVQTLLPIMLNHVAAGRLNLSRLADLTAHGPARVFNIADKGRIARGYDADLVLVDLKKHWVIEESWIASKSGWTPYAEQRVIGKPVATIVRGHIAMRDGALQGQPTGQPVRFDNVRTS